MISMSYIKDKYEMDKRKKYLEKHPYAVWEGRNGFWYTHFPLKGGGRCLRKRKSQKELEDLVVEYWRQREENPTVQDVFESWIKERENYNEIERSTINRYERDFERFFEKTGFARKKIKEIQEDDIERFIKNQIAQNGLTAKAYSGLRLVIKGIFKYAKKKGYTEISISEFFGDLEIPKSAFRKRAVERDAEVLLEKEIPVFIRYLEEHQTILNLGVLLALQTGLRVGELSTLKWIDVEGNMLKVRRTEEKIRDNDGKHKTIVKDFTKTEAGIRDVVLPEGAKDTLGKIRELNPRGTYVFEYQGSKCGERIKGIAFNGALTRALNNLGMKHRSMHKLRKTYCTILIDAGCDDSVVMRQMGHRSMETSRRYYYYCNKTVKQQVEQVENAVSF